MMGDGVGHPLEHRELGLESRGVEYEPGTPHERTTRGQSTNSSEQAPSPRAETAADEAGTYAAAARDTCSAASHTEDATAADQTLRLRTSAAEASFA